MDEPQQARASAVFGVANWFISRRREEKPFTLMGLMGITYLAHGWHLETRNLPLFTDKVEAWQIGVVVPTLYEAFKGQGNSIAKPKWETAEADANFLEQIYRVYGAPSLLLSNALNAPGGAWDIAIKIGGPYVPIVDELTLMHFRDKRRRDALSLPSER